MRGAGRSFLAGLAVVLVAMAVATEEAALLVLAGIVLVLLAWNTWWVG